MALNAYLKLKGQKQGVVKGSVTQKGREGKIMVISAHHEVVSPTDPASGLATGKHLHKPFVIAKEVDKSSPVLYNIDFLIEILNSYYHLIIVNSTLLFIFRSDSYMFGTNGLVAPNPFGIILRALTPFIIR